MVALASGSRSAVSQALRALARRVLPDPIAHLLQDLAAWRRWRKHPTYRATRVYLNQRGWTVKAGPCQGLRYTWAAGSLAKPLVARLIGSYEREIHSALTGLLESRRYSVLVDIGAAEGYYAVGLAQAAGNELRVVAYESDPRYARLCRRLATHNGIENHLEVRGQCGVEQLRQLSGPGRRLVICDIDGGEVELMDPSSIDWLAGADCIIETHDPLAKGATDVLAARFAPTHEVEFVASEPRFSSEFSDQLDGLGLSQVEQTLVVTEFRPWPQGWLVCRASD